MERRICIIGNSEDSAAAAAAEIFKAQGFSVEIIQPEDAEMFKQTRVSLQKMSIPIEIPEHVIGFTPPLTRREKRAALRKKK